MDNIFREGSASEGTLLDNAGGAVSRVGKGIHATGQIIGAGASATAAIASNAVSSTVSSIPFIGDRLAGTANALVPGFLPRLGTFGVGATIGAVLAGVGGVARVFNAVVHGEGGKAIDLTARAVAETGTAAVSGMTFGLLDLGSLAANHKFLSTNAGDLAENAANWLRGGSKPALKVTAGNIATVADLNRQALSAAATNTVADLNQQAIGAAARGTIEVPGASNWAARVRPSAPSQSFVTAVQNQGAEMVLDGR